MQAFLQALASNPQWYLLALLLSTAGVALLVRPSMTTLYDPWALQQVQTIFASAAVIFMWIEDIINPSLMIYHVAALSSFLLCAGFFFRQTIRSCWVSRRVQPRALNSLRGVMLAIFVVSQLGAWALAGIPLFLESRLDAFSSGGGIGILSRIVSFTSFATAFLTVLRVGIANRKRLNLTDGFVLAFTIVASVANASKTNIVLTLLIILMSHWIFQHVIQDYAAPRVSRKKLISLALVLGTLVLVPVAVDMTRDSGVEATGPLEAVFIRLIFSGDGYMWMYGDDYLSKITVNSPTALLFADFLGVTRLMSWDQLPVHPGLQIFQDLFPDSDSIRGPNLRVDTFGLLYGSMVFGVIFAAFLGAVFGLLRGWLFKARSAVFFLPAAYMFFQAPTFLVDPLLGVTALVNTAFAMAIVVFAVSLVGKDPFGAGMRMRFRLGPAKRAKRAPVLSPSL